MDLARMIEQLEETNCTLKDCHDELQTINELLIEIKRLIRMRLGLTDD